VATYLYQCVEPSCAEQVEREHSVHVDLSAPEKLTPDQRPQAQCPKCGAQLKRLIAGGTWVHSSAASWRQ
jgi:predicted nucleic acid-binding Zn ribbon protein